MPQFAEYELWLCDWTGASIVSLSGPDLVSLEWQHVLNGPGVFKLTLVAETGTRDEFIVDYGVQIMRDAGAGFYEEFYGFYHDPDEWLASGNVDEHYWSASGMSAEWLLDQPLLQPMLNANPNYTRYDLWWAHGAADDVMKRMVAESMGLDAEVARQFSNFTVQGDTGAGIWDCYEGYWDRLLESVQALSGERGATDFRVVRVADGFEFRTYSPYYGTDRRQGYAAEPTVFSLELENVRNPRRRVLRHAEVTAVYGGWQGGGQDRDIYTDTNPTALAESPFRRREAFEDISDVTQAEAIPGILAQMLVDQGQLVEVSFELIQTADCLYGVHWRLGDLVTLELWGGTYDMRIVEVNGRISGPDSAQDEEIVGVAELWTRGETA